MQVPRFLDHRFNKSRKEPTPARVFFNRRQLLAGAVAASAHSILGCRSSSADQILEPALERPDVFPTERNAAFALPAGIERAPSPRLTAGKHNNFYEFLPGRGGQVWRHVEDFEVEPWTVEVVGECHKPRTYDLDDLFGFPHQERLYHFRCVEKWAMNLPWSGFPLSKLLERVEPTASARYVRFVSAQRPSQMPGIEQTDYYPWPYHEALRLDEALNELVLLVTGIYGAPLPKQHGAPARVIVPWKYGYKSPKSVVRIELVREQPSTFWQIQPHEYGFLSNVNPNIPHPRWTQQWSYWLDDDLLAPVITRRFDTPLFNGYEEYVTHLYPDEPRVQQRPLRAGEIAR